MRYIIGDYSIQAGIAITPLPRLRWWHAENLTTFALAKYMLLFSAHLMTMVVGLTLISVQLIVGTLLFALYSEWGCWM